MAKKRNSENEIAWVHKQFPSYKKNRDNFKLLLSDKSFQSRITEIRDFLHLPKDGYHKEIENYDEKFQEWHDNMLSESEEIMLSSEFKEELKSLHERMVAKEISYMEHEDLRRKLHDTIPLNYLTRQSKLLAKEFNAPLNYKDGIRHYILFNDPSRMPMTPFSETRGSEEDHNENSITLTFYSKVTDKDWNLIKKTINKNYGRDLPEFQPLKDLDMKLAVENYYQNRDVLDEVERESYRLTAKEIAENILADTGKKIKPDDVFQVIKELNKRRSKRFGKDLDKDSPQKSR